MIKKNHENSQKYLMKLIIIIFINRSSFLTSFFLDLPPMEIINLNVGLDWNLKPIFNRVFCHQINISEFLSKIKYLCDNSFRSSISQNIPRATQSHLSLVIRGRNKPSSKQSKLRLIAFMNK